MGYKSWRESRGATEGSGRKRRKARQTTARDWREQLARMRKGGWVFWWEAGPALSGRDVSVFLVEWGPLSGPSPILTPGP